MRKFDTKVQHLKYKVLREVARESWNGTLMEACAGHSQDHRSRYGAHHALLCVQGARHPGGARYVWPWAATVHNPNVIEVIDIACDECPVGGYEVTNACRGCLAHRCEDVCRRGAITFDAQHVGAYRQEQVRGVRPVRQGLPLHRHCGPEASLRERLQGEGHFHERAQGRHHRQ